jgi:hypothetical protein
MPEIGTSGLAPRVKSDLFSHEDNAVAIVAAGYAVELVGEAR